MSKRFLWIIAIFMAFAMLGLIFVQAYWINDAYRLKEKQFSQAVNRAMHNIANELQERENYTQKIINFLKQSNINDIYISIDIDALDPSIAPGTGFAIPGGLTYRELWLILRQIAEEFNIIAFDIVEVAPNLDLPNNITSNLATKIIMELMSFISTKKKGV